MRMEEPPIVSGAEPPPVPGPSVAPSSAGAKDRRFPCKGCGASLEYKPGSDSVRCPYCGFQEKIALTDSEISEFNFNDYLAKPKTGLGGEGKDLPCTQCGAWMRFERDVKATRCPFCGIALVDRDGDEGPPDIRPEAIAPFRVKEADAEKLFFEWVRKLWFAPSLLKQEMNRTKIRGVYLPFWTFDSQTLSSYSGQRGDYYYTTEVYTSMVNGKPVTRTRQVRHVRWSFVSGRYDHFFDDVVVAAAKQNPPLAYNYKDLVAYDAAYLAGFDAMRPSIAVEGGWATAKQWIQSAIYSACCQLIGGDEQRGVTVQTAFRGITFKMVLLPVYISTYRFKDKLYRFQVDGQTGQVKGDRPWSFWKIAGFVLLMLAIVGVLVLGALAVAASMQR
jgi:LSD1 subclass zinc finger protein